MLCDTVIVALLVVGGKKVGWGEEVVGWPDVANRREPVGKSAARGTANHSQDSRCCDGCPVERFVAVNKDVVSLFKGGNDEGECAQEWCLT